MKNKSCSSRFLLPASGAILLLMQTSSPAQSLQNRWSFSEPAGSTTVTDSVSSAVGTLQGDAGLDGSGNLALDGVGGTCVTLPGNLLAGLQAVTFEGWCYSDVAPDNVHLFEFGDEGGTGNNYLRYVLHDSGNARNQFESSAGGNYLSTASPTGWGGQQLHVVCVYDPANGQRSIYTNGVLEAVGSGGVTPLSQISAAGGSLGRSPWYNYGDPYLSGTISEFRIWNGALNPLQIAATEGAGPDVVSTNYGTVTKLQIQEPFQLDQYALQQAVVVATASGTTLQPNIASICTYSSANTNIITISAAGVLSGLAPGSTIVTASFGTVSNSQTFSVLPAVAVLSNRWSFYAPPAGSLTVTDSVHGVVAALNGNASLDGTEVNLDGTSGTYVELGANLLVGISTVSCEAWVPTNAVSPDNVHLYDFSDGGGTGSSYFRYNLHSSANSQNFSELHTALGYPKMTSGVGLGGTGMLHIVTVYDPAAQVWAIYTNGALEAVQTGTTAPLSGVSPNEASLGQSPWFGYGDPYLNGSISEFRIYSGELSPQRIAMDFQSGPTSLNTAGPGALKSIALNLGATIKRGDSMTTTLLATYDNLPNFNIIANSILPLAGLTITSSANNIIGVTNNVLTALSNGTATITASYQGFTNRAALTVYSPAFRYNWSAPVPFDGLDADQILTNAPGLIVGAAVFGSTAQTVTLGNGQVITFTTDGSVATASGSGTFSGAYPAGTGKTTGNADFDAVLNEAKYDGGPKIITVTNLTAGQYYSVQFFGLDDRSGQSNRLASFQDPNYGLDVSATFTMGTNVYVVGTFWASNTTAKVQMNLPSSNAGNINALVVRQLPTVAMQRMGSSLQLTWPIGTLLEAPAVSGPWTATGNTSPYTLTPTDSHKFYKVSIP